MSCHIATFCKSQHPVHVSFVQTAYAPQDPFVHTLDNFSCMGFAEMGIAFDHLEGRPRTSAISAMLAPFMAK